jgi:hypothetical protein
MLDLKNFEIIAQYLIGNNQTNLKEKHLKTLNSYDKIQIQF